MAGGNLAPMHLAEPGSPTGSQADDCCSSAGTYQPPSSNSSPIIHQEMTSKSGLDCPRPSRSVPQVVHTRLLDGTSAAAAGARVYSDSNVVQGSVGYQEYPSIVRHPGLTSKSVDTNVMQKAVG